MVVIRDHKPFDQILMRIKYDTEFSIKISESLAEIKNEIEQLFSKYKDGNNIHEHKKQQNK